MPVDYFALACDIARASRPAKRPNACVWCLAPLPPLALASDDPARDVVVALGRLCQACAEKQEEAR